MGEARRALGIEHLVLSIHDASFPSRADEDTGRGSPYSRGARDLLEWAQDQGFTGIQFGPQGETSAMNPSPYDGTIFAKSILSLALGVLAEEGLVDRRTLDEIVRGVPSAPDRVAYAYAYRAHRDVVTDVHARIDRNGPRWKRFERWRATNAAWLERDARYEAWSKAFGTDDWQRWPSLLPEVDPDETFELGQFLVHEQHAVLLSHADANGLQLFGDLQIGLSHRDRFRREHIFLQGWAMGAPPSRTNPEGQPWGYPVRLPRSAEADGLMSARAAKIFSEFHGLRIDHPHGHVCPWVYRLDVKEGRRLFESPDDPDLGQYAIARPEQLDWSVPRHADPWVTALDDEQVERYARRITMLTDAAKAFGRSENDVLLEVLSTCPYPLLRVLEKRGLGRFRVTQKADPKNPGDVYSTHQARRGDWVMLGNHDTEPIWTRVRRLDVDGWCDHLVARLGKGAIDRGAAHADARSLVQPMFVDLLACDAGNVAVFFADLFGQTEIYNTPGVVSADNWTLRAPRDFAQIHAQRAARGHALDVPSALATALRVRGETSLAARLPRGAGP